MVTCVYIPKPVCIYRLKHFRIAANDFMPGAPASALDQSGIQVRYAELWLGTWARDIHAWWTIRIIEFMLGPGPSQKGSDMIQLVQSCISRCMDRAHFCSSPPFAQCLQGLSHGCIVASCLKP